MYLSSVESVRHLSFLTMDELILHEVSSSHWEMILSMVIFSRSHCSIVLHFQFGRYTVPRRICTALLPVQFMSRFLSHSRMLSEWLWAATINKFRERKKTIWNDWSE